MMASTRLVEPGGAGNFMIAARRMGLDVWAAGTVGSDAFGSQILEMLRREGIDINYVVIIPGATSTIVIALIDPETNAHAFIGEFGWGPTAPYPGGLDQRIQQADALFFQGYTLADPRTLPMARRALETARRAGIAVFFDGGPFMSRVSPDDIRLAIGASDALLMTEDEVPLLSDGRTGDAAYGRLLAQGPRALVVRLGAAGCAVITRNRAEIVPGFEVPVVDTIGAGDCFDAAFVAGRLQGLDWWESALLANAMGAAAAQRVGAGRNAPTCDDVIAILRDAGEALDYRC
jgi:ribokinase